MARLEEDGGGRVPCVGRGDEGSWASRAMEGDGRGQQTRITKEVGRLRRTSLEAACFRLPSAAGHGVVAFGYLGEGGDEWGDGQGASEVRVRVRLRLATTWP